MGNQQLQVSKYRLIENSVTSKEPGRSLESGGLLKKKGFQPYSLGGNSQRAGLICPAVATDIDKAVCMKVLLKKKKDSDSQVKAFAREAGILSLCKHPNIVKFLDVFQDDSRLYLVQELGTQGNMFSKHIQRDPKDAALKKKVVVKELFRQLVDAIGHLHDNQIAHMDIKPQNVVCTDESTVKLCDFGESTKLDKDQTDFLATQEHALLGTWYYIDPEMKKKINDAFSASRDSKPRIEVKPYDIFSLGCVLFELMTGHLAFPGNSSLKSEDPAYKHYFDNYESQLLQKRWPENVGNFPSFDEIITEYDEEAVALLMKMWHPITSERATIDDLRESALYKEGYSMTHDVDLVINEALLDLFHKAQNPNKETNAIDFNINAEKVIVKFKAKKQKLASDEKTELSQYEDLMVNRSAVESVLPQFHGYGWYKSTTFNRVMPPEPLMGQIEDALIEMTKQSYPDLQIDVDDDGFGICGYRSGDEEQSSSSSSSSSGSSSGSSSNESDDEDEAGIVNPNLSFQILLFYQPENEKETIIEFQKTNGDQREFSDFFYAFQDVFAKQEKAFRNPSYVSDDIDDVVMF